MNLEPDNADMFYFRAKLALEQGDEVAVVEALRQSIEHGYTNRQRLQSEFPEDVLRQL